MNSSNTDCFRKTKNCMQVICDRSKDRSICTIQSIWPDLFVYCDACMRNEIWHRVEYTRCLIFFFHPGSRKCSVAFAYVREKIWKKNLPIQLIRNQAEKDWNSVVSFMFIVTWSQGRDASKMAAHEPLTLARGKYFFYTTKLKDILHFRRSTAMNRVLFGRLSSMYWNRMQS